jgi:arginase
MDLGQNRRGVDMGPSAIRYARLNATFEDLGYLVTDLGDVQTPVPETVGEEEAGDNLAAIRGVCEKAAEKAARMVSNGLFPVFLGGDHSVSIGTVRGSLASWRAPATVPAYYGSTPTPTSTRPRPHPLATSTVCRSPSSPALAIPSW